jgi:hypothetical protein
VPLQVCGSAWCGVPSAPRPPVSAACLLSSHSPTIPPPPQLLTTRPICPAAPTPCAAGVPVQDGPFAAYSSGAPVRRLGPNVTVAKAAELVVHAADALCRPPWLRGGAPWPGIPARRGGTPPRLRFLQLPNVEFELLHEAPGVARARACRGRALAGHPHATLDNKQVATHYKNLEFVGLPHLPQLHGDPVEVALDPRAAHLSHLLHSPAVLSDKVLGCFRGA